MYIQTLVVAKLVRGLALVLVTVSQDTAIVPTQKKYFFVIFQLYNSNLFNNAASFPSLRVEDLQPTFQLNFPIFPEVGCVEICLTNVFFCCVVTSESLYNPWWSYNHLRGAHNVCKWRHEWGSPLKINCLNWSTTDWLVEVIQFNIDTADKRCRKTQKWLHIQLGVAVADHQP